MGVKWRTKTNKLPKMSKTIGALCDKSIEVGAIEGEHAWLGAIHEHGAHVVAKKAQYLTVPVNPKAHGKRAAEFDGLFVYTAKSGEKFLAKSDGKSLELYYWLTKEVNIPARRWLSRAHDEQGESVLKACERALGLVIHGEMSMEEYFTMLGRDYATMVKDFVTDMKDPPNSPITSNVKGSDNPLNDTGDFIRSISYRVK